VELVVTAAMLLLVVQASWWVVAGQARASAGVVEGGRVAEARRVTRHLLASELAFDAGSGELTLVDGEMRLRGFRGVAAFCAGSGSTWWVNVSGVRDPALGKDSVIVYDRWSGWLVAEITGRRTGSEGGCAAVPGFSQERWEVDRELEAPVVGRYFERTGYRFSAGAFRTLAGTSWQPVTEASLDTDRSSLSLRGDGAVEVVLSWDGPSPFQQAATWVVWKGW